jgi:hypothetical protein
LYLPGLDTTLPNILDTTLTIGVASVETGRSAVAIESDRALFGVPSTDKSHTPLFVGRKVVCGF